MDRINSVKLGLNNDMEVVVTADIQMKSGVDTDDVYFVMFNVLDDPLRFVVATASNFEEFLLKKGVPSATLSSWLAENPELFMGEIVKHQMEVMGNAVERVKVSLDQQSNADVARTVILSMIDKGYFLNVSNYHIPGQTEPIQRTQKVETAALLPDFQMMLDVVKNWEGFDFSEYLRSKGVSEEDIKQMVGA
ncbi:hypothetical protein N9M03_00790 [bacterium]|nr:hypothetical protein [bacterium]